MSDSLSALIGHLKRLLSPLGSLAGGDLKRLGLPLNDAQVDQLEPALDQIRAAAGHLLETALDLDAAIAADDSGLSATISIDAGVQVGQLISGFDALQSAVSGLGVPNAGAIVSAFPNRLLHFLLSEYTGRLRGLNEALELIGILERVDHNVGEVDPNKPFYTVDTFHFDRIGGWIGDPQGQLQALYGFGGNVDYTHLFDTIARVTGGLGMPVLRNGGSTPSVDLLVARLQPTNTGPDGLSIALGRGLNSGTAEWSGSNWTWTFGLDANVPVDTEIVLRPWEVSVQAPELTSLTGQASAKYEYVRTKEDPLRLLTLPGDNGISVEKVGAVLGIRVDSGGGTVPELGLQLSGGRVSLGMGDADGFIGSLLGALKLDSNFDLSINYSFADGLRFSGSSTLEIQLASHISLGPLEIKALTLVIGIDGVGLLLGATANLGAELGPVVGIVEGIGLGVTFEYRPNSDGNLGPIHLVPKFIPPKGIGLSVDAVIVYGGGYLYFDPDREEYAGALELGFAGIVTIKAIGLLTTRMPDGSKGFSLLLILSVEFGSGIQLGFGFTLLAVGGLVDLNRTMNLEALMEGIRTGAIESVMFPKDIIANAPKIISDLKGLFPPQADTFLVGPMVKIGWGTPTLVSISLGLVLEIPAGNFAIVGILKVALPADDLALIVLQVNFAGAVEPAKKRMFFFAALYDSRVIFITIEGEMGLLMAFGDDANFVLSVGGFHPQFSPPPLPFPSPKRIAVNILNTSVAKIRVEGYFAVTSNTVQFGARLEVFFGFSALNVKGHLAFDALFQFSPFFFSISISASLSVNVFGAGLFSVHISGLLEGPAKWHVKGYGSITILLFEVEVEIDERWGESKDTKLPPIEVLPLLAAELDKVENWKAIPPPNSHLSVSLRTIPPDPENPVLVLHPLGKLRMSQRAVPLELDLDKVGQKAPSDVDRISLSVQGDLVKTADTFEPFARAQFKKLKNAKKLSQPAYSPEVSGLEVAPVGDRLRSSLAVERVVRFEEIIIDNNFKRHLRRFARTPSGLFRTFLRGAAASKCKLSQSKKKLADPAPEKIEVAEEQFAVAFVSDNTPVASEAASFASKAAAEDYLFNRIDEEPELAAELHVIPSFETAA